MDTTNNQLQQMTVVDMDTDFVKATREFERFALTYSKEMAKLFGDNESDSELNLDRFVVLSNLKSPKRVYRKCMARNGVKSTEVAIGYRTQKELGVSTGDKITIENARWFQYYWHNSEKYEKWMFIFALLSLTCGVLSFLIQIAQLLCCGLCG